MSGLVEVNAVFSGNLAHWERDDKAATDGALKECAEAVQRAIQARTRRGYRTGKFAKGRTAASIQISRFSTQKGDRTIRVYTKDFIARLWELGHQNAWTKRFERVEHWKNAIIGITALLPDLFRRAYSARMIAWSGMPTASHRNRRRAVEEL